MLSADDLDFLSKEMKIVPELINLKLEERPLQPYRNKIEKAIKFFIRIARNVDHTSRKKSPEFFMDTPERLSIDEYYAQVSDTIPNDEANAILDSFRHAFCSFSSGGLHQLFIGQENENWYPKIILDCKLEPNEIAALPELITIYRGADKSELISRNFGQSWTTCEKVAHDFAYKHYQNHDWFDKDRRVVFKTVIPKDFVYYAGPAPEHEVAINTNSIGTVELFSRA